MAENCKFKLPALPYLKLRLHLSTQKDCRLPAYKGSLLRGAFGHALRKTVCVLGPQQACETCMLRFQCIYPRLFETFIEGEPPRFLRGLTTAPRPYLFEPFQMQQNYNRGDLLQFNLLLFGQATELYPYVIYAVSQMAEAGLGRDRTPFRLETVDWQSVPDPQAEPGPGTGPKSDFANPGMNSLWQQLYDGQTWQLLTSPVPLVTFGNNHINSQSADFSSSGDLPEIESCTLQFQTPTRLKFLFY